MRFKIVLSTIAFLVLANTVHAQEKILIAAASDLRFAMDSVISVFAENHPGKVGITYGSSGKLTEQIINGAPFDIFFSADIAYPEKLQSENKASSNIYPY